MIKRAGLAAGLVLLTLFSGGCAGQRQSAADPPQFVPFSSAATATASEPGATPASDPPNTPAKPSLSPTPRRADPTPTPDPAAGPFGTRRMTGVRGVALTFDDGPHPEWTPKFLDQLRAAEVKATFCLIGVKVRSYPQLVARIVREGHTLCNHSWQHDLRLGKRSAAAIRADLIRTNREIHRIVPDTPIAYYRQPGGEWTQRVVNVARELGMESLHWDVDPRDWDKKVTTAQISKRIRTQSRSGSIVLMHDGGGDRSRTLTACQGLLDTLQQRYGIVQLG